MTFKKIGRLALCDGRLRVEIDTVGSFHFDNNCLVGEDGRQHGYAMPSATGKAVNLHLTDGALCTVIKSQLLQVISGNIRKAAVFEVA